MLGKYRLVAVLGRGGMGTVYAAEDSVIKRRVAIKVLPPEVAQDPSLVGRLLAEAQSAGRLNHPNVVTIYDVGQVDGTSFIVMEHLGGGSVQDYLTRNGSPGWRAATRLTAEASKALAAAHETGLIHRDVKPANLLLTADGHVKVADFGLAKPEAVDATMHTQPGTLLGTPAYMSPEQCRGDKVDARTDLYSLACTYYAMLTGKPPFEAASSIQVMFAHCSAPVPDPRDINGEAPDGCFEVLRKGLAKNPDERYGSAKDMLADLRAVLGGVSVARGDPLQELAAQESRAEPSPEQGQVAHAPGSTRPIPQWLLPAGGALAGAVVVALLVFALWPSGRPRSEATALAPAASTLSPAASVDVPFEPERPPIPQPPHGGGQPRAHRPPPPPVLDHRPPPAEAPPDPLSPPPAETDAPQVDGPPPSAPPAVPAPPVAPESPPSAELVNSVGQRLVLIQPGKFQMGDGKRPDAPRHEVTLTKPFYMGATEVTQGDLLKVLGPAAAGNVQREELPAAFISWDEATEFCRRLSDLPEEREAGRVYRLPTEAEWEYACRAGSETRFAFGDALTAAQANFGKKFDARLFDREGGNLRRGDRPPPRGSRPPPPSGDRRPPPGDARGRRFEGRGRGGPGPGPGRPGHPPEPNDPGGGPGEPGPRPLERAGSFPGNAWGLHDMHGSVWEWCSDFYARDAYTATPRTDPTGPPVGKSHVARGGSWLSPAEQCTSAYRNANPAPAERRPVYGFRVVCEVRRR